MWQDLVRSPCRKHTWAERRRNFDYPTPGLGRCQFSFDQSYQQDGLVLQNHSSRPTLSLHPYDYQDTRATVIELHAASCYILLQMFG